MTTADQLAIVEAKLGNEVRATLLADGGLVQGWMKTRRLLVLVQRAGLHAVFVFVSSSFPVSSQGDLVLESILPIDADFRCEIDSGDAVLISISSGGASRTTKLMFEMLPGYHTQNFVAELYRLTDSISSKQKSTDPATDFSWTSKYLPPRSKESLESSMDKLSTTDSSRDAAMSFDVASSSNSQSGDRDSPESSLNRQEIAMTGVTPIAARESVVKYQMALKEEQFTHVQNFTIFIGTWNVNGQSPSSGPVTSWLACDENPPDLYVIGFQELDLSKEAFIFQESPKEDEWLAVVTASLHPRAKYLKVKLVRLVGMMLIVFIKAEHWPHIRDVAAETVGTGIMGKLGNKGGVAVRLDFHNTSICLVNSHLAAHVTEFERRNQDYQDICSRLSFTQFAPAKAIKDHDMVYWLGDLNYRITDMDAQGVKELLAENNLTQLLAIDQFHQQRQRRKAFVGYSEGIITFPPTYKYDPGTDIFDSSEKFRAPAWTDRILWKGTHIEQKVYRSHMELKISDHKPVSAVFCSGMKVVDPAKYRRIYEDVMKKLDRLENEFLPQVTVDTTEIIFGTIKFIEPRNKMLTVANTGQVPVQFEFIKKLNDKSFCKPWLSVEPGSGFVMPGDKCDIVLEILVDKKTAGPLTSGQDQMYDILVLHLIGGKDIFVTVSGEYQKSSFGASINALCRMSVPICELSAGTLMEMEGTATARKDDGGGGGGEGKQEVKREEEPYPVPKEMWFLCDLITTLGLGTENLFLQSGLRTEVILIREWLDTGLPVDKPKVSIHSAAEALLLFLESLRDPILPYNVYSRSLDASQNYLQCKQIVAQLPFHHKQVFNYLTAFLREVLRHSTQNGMDPKILASLFSGIFLRDPPGTYYGTGLKAKTHQQLLDTKKAKFIYYFIANEPDD